jgi:hypothetical protein
MADNLNIAVHVLATSENGVQVATAASTGWTFWVGRHKGATWVEPPQVGKFQTVILPMWAAKFHKQLNSAVDYERRARAEYQRPIQTQQKEAIVAEDRDLSGVLFRIDESKRKNDKWPTHDGHVIVHGEKLYLSAWVKESKSGTKYFSLALKPADEKPAANGRPQAKVAHAVDNSEIPLRSSTWRRPARCAPGHWP